MSKLKDCSTCGKEVAKSAKMCPHCGKKLKMGFFGQLGVLLGVFLVAGMFLGETPNTNSAPRVDPLASLANTQPVSSLPLKELSEIFKLGSRHTDIQRENKERELVGKVAQLELQVYEVSKRGSNKYRIQTSGRTNEPSAFVTVHTRSAEERTYVEGLMTGDLVSFKGRIKGTRLRSLNFDPAIVVGM